MNRNILKKLLCITISMTMLFALGSVAIADETEEEWEETEVSEVIEETDDDIGVFEEIIETTEESLVTIESMEEDMVSEDDIEEETVPEDEDNIEVEIIEEDDVLASSDNGWKYIDGYKYLYIDCEYVTGWQKINNKWRFFDSDGKQISGWKKIDGKWYYLNPNDYCTMTIGYMYIDGKYYYFNDDGTMFTGWRKNYDGYWEYYLKNGARAEGWQKIDGKWYYFNYMQNGSSYSYGHMRTGDVVIDGKRYFLDENGVMQTGWIDFGEYIYMNFLTGSYYNNLKEWHYYGSDGVAVTGWKKINNKWYYFKDEGGVYSYQCGSVCVGLRLIDGSYYYFDENGVMQTGWVDDNHIYCGSDGKAFLGWKKIDGKWYYYSPSQSRFGLSQIDDKYYYFDENGAMMTGWIVIYNGEYYYADPSGRIMTSEWKKIKGKWYYFDSKHEMKRAGYQIIDGHVYHFDDNGVCLNPYG